MKTNKRTIRCWQAMVLIIAVVAASLGVGIALGDSASARQIDPFGPSEQDSQSELAPFIVAGSEVNPPGQYPFVVAVFDAIGQLCGGSLIDSEWVLTAAHCFYDGGSQVLFPADVAVVAAVHNIDTGPGEVLFATDVIIHPNYTDSTLANDIALIRLATPSALGASIRLAQPGDSALWAGGKIGTTMGWGNTNPAPGSFSPSPTLQETDMTFWSDAQCASWWGPGFVSATQICASNPPTAGHTCLGDSGGPMVVPAGQGLWTLVGVTSYVDATGCNAGPPGFTEVASFVGWIESWIGLPSLCEGRVVTIDMNTNGGYGTGTIVADVILGSPGPDRISALGGHDVVCAGGGGDTIRGGAGDDLLAGGAGGDTIRGGGGGDTILGGDGADVIDGQGGGDVLYGDGGGDTITGRGAADTILGGPGADTIDGQNGGDLLVGDGGNDVIKGQTGPDVLSGGFGNDDLFGGDGGDVFYGDAGTDKCSGNTGPDQASAASCESTPGVETLF